MLHHIAGVALVHDQHYATDTAVSMVVVPNKDATQHMLDVKTVVICLLNKMRGRFSVILQHRGQYVIA